MNVYVFSVNITVEASNEETAEDSVKKSLGDCAFKDFDIEWGPNEIEEEEN